MITEQEKQEMQDIMQKIADLILIAAENREGE